MKRAGKASVLDWVERPRFCLARLPEDPPTGPARASPGGIFREHHFCSRLRRQVFATVFFLFNLAPEEQSSSLPVLYC